MVSVEVGMDIHQGSGVYILTIQDCDWEHAKAIYQQFIAHVAGDKHFRSQPLGDIPGSFRWMVEVLA